MCKFLPGKSSPRESLPASFTRRQREFSFAKLRAAVMRVYTGVVGVHVFQRRRRRLSLLSTNSNSKLDFLRPCLDLEDAGDADICVFLFPSSGIGMPVNHLEIISCSAIFSERKSATRCVRPTTLSLIPLGDEISGRGE